MADVLKQRPAIHAHCRHHCQRQQRDRHDHDADGSREISTNGARCVREMDWPPYWFEAICAMIWVAMLQAVEKLCGFSMSVPDVLRDAADDIFGKMEK